ncbi:MAG: radical SAM protein [Clostridia bacterium]|nr:radical SAM protein [Clostridia bacterium]MDE7216425.1 radical SAM protein [Clostridia bacterium]
MHSVRVKSILSPKNGMNIYRGCLHGCIYCDSRSDCYQMRHDFEDIEIKENAVELLENTLKRKRKKCMIGTGSMTDPYLPLEKTLGNVRKALQIIERYGFGFTAITKSDLILRDLDILKRINEKTKCVVQMTLTTYDEDLCRKLEPNVCSTKRRAEVLNILRDNGIPTVVWLSPILPFINDTKENIDGILKYCAEAKVYGIICFGMGMTLRDGNREYYYKQLDKHFPKMAEKYKRIYGNSYIVDSPNNEELSEYFTAQCKKYGIICDNDKLFEYLHTFEEKQIYEQMSMF